MQLPCNSVATKWCKRSGTVVFFCLCADQERKFLISPGLQDSGCRSRGLAAEFPLAGRLAVCSNSTAEAGAPNVHTKQVSRSQMNFAHVSQSVGFVLYLNTNPTVRHDIVQAPCRADGGCSFIFFCGCFPLLVACRGFWNAEVSVRSTAVASPAWLGNIASSATLKGSPWWINWLPPLPRAGQRHQCEGRSRTAELRVFVIPTLMSLPFARGTSTLLATPARIFWVFGCPALNCGTESSSSEGDVGSAGRD